MKLGIIIIYSVLGVLSMCGAAHRVPYLNDKQLPIGTLEKLRHQAPVNASIKSFTAESPTMLAGLFGYKSCFSFPSSSNSFSDDFSTVLIGSPQRIYVHTADNYIQRGSLPVGSEVIQMSVNGSVIICKDTMTHSYKIYTRTGTGDYKESPIIITPVDEQVAPVIDSRYYKIDSSMDGSTIAFYNDAMVMFFSQDGAAEYRQKSIISLAAGEFLAALNTNGSLCAVQGWSGPQTPMPLKLFAVDTSGYYKKIYEAPHESREDLHHMSADGSAFITHDYSTSRAKIYTRDRDGRYIQRFETAQYKISEQSMPIRVWSTDLSTFVVDNDRGEVRVYTQSADGNYRESYKTLTGNYQKIGELSADGSTMSILHLPQRLVRIYVRDNHGVYGERYATPDGMQEKVVNCNHDGSLCMLRVKGKEGKPDYIKMCVRKTITADYVQCYTVPGPFVTAGLNPRGSIILTRDDKTSTLYCIRSIKPEDITMVQRDFLYTIYLWPFAGNSVFNMDAQQSVVWYSLPQWMRSAITTNTMVRVRTVKSKDHEEFVAKLNMLIDEYKQKLHHSLINSTELNKSVEILFSTMKSLLNGSLFTVQELQKALWRMYQTIKPNFNKKTTLAKGLETVGKKTPALYWQEFSKKFEELIPGRG